MYLSILAFISGHSIHVVYWHIIHIYVNICIIASWGHPAIALQNECGERTLHLWRLRSSLREAVKITKNQTTIFCLADRLHCSNDVFHMRAIIGYITLPTLFNSHVGTRSRMQYFVGAFPSNRFTSSTVIAVAMLANSIDSCQDWAIAITWRWLLVMLTDSLSASESLKLFLNKTQPIIH